MKTFTVSFFGHRVIDHVADVERKLENTVRDLLLTHEYVEFLVGRDGDFDQLASSAVRRCKKPICGNNSALVLILPYKTAEYLNNMRSFHEYYDEVEICADSAEKYFKAAHQIRNSSMVDRSDMVIFYVDHDLGGAFKTMRYAKKTGTTFVNLSDDFSI